MSEAVLIIEDDWVVMQAYVRKLSSFRVLEASTLSGAQTLFLANQDKLVGVIVDGSLSGTELDTLELIRWMRSQGFQGTMIAASTSGRYMQQMVAAGCTRAIGKLNLARSLPDVFA